MGLLELGKPLVAALTGAAISTRSDSSVRVEARAPRRPTDLDAYAYVKALGGELEIRARLPGAQEVRITQFEHLGELADISERPRPAERMARLRRQSRARLRMGLLRTGRMHRQSSDRR